MTAIIINLDDHRTPTPAIIRQIAKSLKGKIWSHICPKVGLVSSPIGTYCGWCGQEDNSGNVA